MGTVVKLLITPVLLMGVCGAVDVSAQIPEQARLLALNKLKNISERLSSGPQSMIFGGTVTKAEIERAVLREGFVHRVGLTNEVLVEAEPARIMEYAPDRIFRFPVIVDGRLIGTIDVRENKDLPGTYKNPHMAWGGPPVVERVQTLRNRFPSEQGYSVSILTVGGQSYAIIDRNSQSILITAVTEGAAYYLGLEPKSGPDYPLLPVDEGVRRLKSEARRYLDFMRNNSYEQ